MPAPAARVARVRTAERAAGPAPSQDRTVVLPTAVAVLDGASAPDPGERDGGWYAGQLAGQLAARLADSSLDLATVLADSIAAVTSRHRLRPGSSPSSTVAMLRWTEEQTEGLVLGDSSLVAFAAGGAVEEVVDDRLAAVAPAQRVAYQDRLAEGTGYDDEHLSLLRRLAGEQRRHRNSPGGYWIAEAEPAAARHALTRSWPAGALDAAVLATDGVTRGVGHPGLPTWSATLDLAAASGPAAVLDAVRAAEDADPDGRRWPRSKRHDDQSLVVVTWAL
ncbi:MAG: protein phosphatase 2C domain-containing protein [Mycobacteriales bacterium]